jgi:V8-like Glu-specific endopeptidase
VTVVDMACFPGSSGSPVLVYNNGAYADKNGATSIGSRLIFIGVLFSGPILQEDGEVVIKNIPTKTIPVAEFKMMINLGYIIKPKEITSLGKAMYAKRGMIYPE